MIFLKKSFTGFYAADTKMKCNEMNDLGAILVFLVSKKYAISISGQDLTRLLKKGTTLKELPFSSLSLSQKSMTVA